MRHPEISESVFNKCVEDLRQIAGSIAGIRGLLDPDDPLLPNHIAVIIPALDSLESNLIAIANLLQNQA